VFPKPRQQTANHLSRSKEEASPHKHVALLCAESESEKRGSLNSTQKSTNRATSNHPERCAEPHTAQSRDPWEACCVAVEGVVNRERWYRS
jgi:hypothetical protein